MKSFRFLITASILSLSTVGCLSTPVSEPVNPAQTSAQASEIGHSQVFVDMNTTPDRYEPMVHFLQENNMSLRDWNTLSEAYYSVGVIYQESQTRLNFLQSLHELVQNSEPANNRESIRNTRKLRRTLNQLGLGRR